MLTTFPNLFAMHQSRTQKLFDHLVGASNQWLRKEILAVGIYRWQLVAGRQPDHAITLRQKERFSADDKCANAFAVERCEGWLELVGSACSHNDKAPAEGSLRIPYDLRFTRR